MALIPAERLIDWTPGTHVGVIGGIPTTRTMYVNAVTEGVDNTGTTDVSAALQVLLDACPADQYVYLPNGTYRIDSTLVMGTNFNGSSLVGQSRTGTIIDQRCNVGITMGSASGLYLSPDLLVTGGLTKGSTSITVSGDITDYQVGFLLVLLPENDDSIPVVSVYNYNYQDGTSPVKQMVRISAKGSGTFDFWPPLHDDYGGGTLAIRIATPTFYAVGIGLENLTIDATNYTTEGGAFSCVGMSNTFGGWIKNVGALATKNYGIGLGDCLNCEVRQCYIAEQKGGGATNGGGFIGTMHSTLVEDNIILDYFPLTEINGGSSGNVFAYNYGDAAGVFNTNHAPHNRFNLWEGNSVGYAVSDGYFGGESEQTFFRNYFTLSSHNLRRFSYRFSFVGNIQQSALGDDGFPNINNNDFNGTSNFGTADYPRDWQMSGELTTRTDAHAGVITLNSGELFGYDGFTNQVIRLVWGAGMDQSRFAQVVSVAGDEATIGEYAPSTGGPDLPAQGTTIYIGPGSYYSFPNGSYQELDLYVAATLVEKGNYTIATDTFSPLDGDPLIDSYFRSSKPSYFGDLNWPPFDPENPESVSVEMIPAGYRYVNGDNPPADPTLTCTTLNVTTFTIG